MKVHEPVLPELLSVQLADVYPPPVSWTVPVGAAPVPVTLTGTVRAVAAVRLVEDGVTVTAGTSVLAVTVIAAVPEAAR